MQPSQRLRNKSTVWTATLRPRVGDVVCDANTQTFFYVNISGYNSVLTDTNAWIFFSQAVGSATPEFVKTAANITGSDPFFNLNMSTTPGWPAKPSKLTVYIDQNGTGNYQLLDPVNYDVASKTFRQLPDPTAFPSMVIDIFASN